MPENGRTPTLTPVQKVASALIALALLVVWQVGVNVFSPPPTVVDSAAVVVSQEAVSCILDQLADHRLEMSSALNTNAAHHSYMLESKGVENDPRRVEQLVNPEACEVFLENDGVDLESEEAEEN